MSADAPDRRWGVVYLVGAGPGDPGLITKRGLDLIERADVIVHDRLVAPDLLEHAREEAELVYAGKDPNSRSTAQETINQVLIDRAREGKLVVRLKGGDPFVFGRGGEEAEALAQAGVPFEAVPGITAAIGAAAYAGIPLTHREQASAVAFVTGHEDPLKDESALDWSAIAAFPGTLVFYMGVRNLTDLAEQLIEHGRPPIEAAAVIERGTLPGQRIVTAPLAEIAQHAAVLGIRPPAVTIVGDVAGLRERLAWFEEAPLRGRQVAVTRARAQVSTLAARLSNLGAEVIELPSIRIEPRLDDGEVRAAVERLAAGRYDLLCLTSPNGVRLLLELLGRDGFEAKVLAGVTIAAIGPGTAGALAEGGVEPDIVPQRSVAESLIEELLERGVEGKRVLIARASEAREVMPRSLEEAGASVDVVALYDTVREDLEADSVAALGDVDYVTFTSSSTVRYFVEALGGVERFPDGARVVSIGPVTTATARELGLRVDAEAEQHDIDGLVSALVADAVAASD
jgi:uroporphyrinogen III methyltransferase/synthase